MEDAIRQPDISKSVQRFVIAIDEAKGRLDLAISPGTWLMPSNLLINTQSTVGYNNSLKKADGDMKLGVNRSLNLGTKSARVKLMHGGKSKIKRPTSHPSHKKVMQETLPNKQTSTNKQILPNEKNSTNNHDILKAGIFISAAVSAFAVYRML